MPESTLNPRIAGSDSIIIKTMLIETAFFRVILKVSITIDRIFSKTAITVDRAAADIALFAGREGLTGHARSALIRTESRGAEAVGTDEAERLKAEEPKQSEQ